MTSYRPPLLGSSISTATSCLFASESENASPKSFDPRQYRLRNANQKSPPFSRALRTYHAANAYANASNTKTPNAAAALIACAPPSPPSRTSLPIVGLARFASVSGARPASACVATSTAAAKATGEKRNEKKKNAPECAPKYARGTYNRGATICIIVTADCWTASGRRSKTAARKKPSGANPAAKAPASKKIAARLSHANRPKKHVRKLKHAAELKFAATRTHAVPSSYARGERPDSTALTRKPLATSSRAVAAAAPRSDDRDAVKYTDANRRTVREPNVRSYAGRGACAYEIRRSRAFRVWDPAAVALVN